VIQCDTPRNLFLRPVSPPVARFFGARNILAGHVGSGAFASEAGSIPVGGPDGPARIAIRAEGVALAPTGPLLMTVREVVFTGSGLRVGLARGAMRLEARLPPDPAPAVGDEVGVSIAPEAVWRFPDDDPAPARHPDGVLHP
jgi:ABC-type Fe3+/spermidine/putrescine transport system ATPase subunit